MTDATKIEWADSTFNPWTGCTKISPACDNCYAESWSKRAGSKVGKWGPGAPRVRTSATNWRQPIKWNAAKFMQCMDCGWRGDVSKPDPVLRGRCPNCLRGTIEPARRRVFCASLADWLDNEVPIEWFIDLLYLCMNTPNLDKLLLTKRIGNFHKRLQQAYDHLAECVRGAPSKMLPCLKAWIDGNPPADIWIGATICNQSELDRDAQKLLAIPARVRFLSIEPMLGPIDLNAVPPPEGTRPINGATIDDIRGCLPKWQESPMRAKLRDGIDWIICGGESGPGARPMHPDWARSLRDQCASAGVPFMFKQWGAYADPYEDMVNEDGSHVEVDCDIDREYFEPTTDCLITMDGSRYSLDTLPEGERGLLVRRFGKKYAGRLLDGVEHNGFPKVAP